MKESLMKRIIAEARQHSLQRKLVFKNMLSTKMIKKIKPEDLRSEVEVARFLGETRMLERIIQLLKSNQDASINDLEANLHLVAEDLLHITSEYLEGKKVFDLDDILTEHGYHVKSSDGN